MEFFFKFKKMTKLMNLFNIHWTMKLWTKHLFRNRTDVFPTKTNETNEKKRGKNNVEQTTIIFAPIEFKSCAEKARKHFALEGTIFYRRLEVVPHSRLHADLLTTKSMEVGPAGESQRKQNVKAAIMTLNVKGCVFLFLDQSKSNRRRCLVKQTHIITRFRMRTTQMCKKRNSYQKTFAKSTNFPPHFLRCEVCCSLLIIKNCQKMLNNQICFQVFQFKNKIEFEKEKKMKIVDHLINFWIVVQFEMRKCKWTINLRVCFKKKSNLSW